MLKSTGHDILDDEVLKTFRKWRFHPGVPDHIRVPVKFSLESR